MLVKVDKVEFNPETCVLLDKIKYDLDIPDDKLVKGITAEFPTYCYALIDGRLFKSDSGLGPEGVFFESKDELEFELYKLDMYREFLELNESRQEIINNIKKGGDIYGK